MLKKNKIAYILFGFLADTEEKRYFCIMVFQSCVQEMSKFWCLHDQQGINQNQDSSVNLRILSKRRQESQSGREWPIIQSVHGIFSLQLLAAAHCSHLS